MICQEGVTSKHFVQHSHVALSAYSSMKAMGRLFLAVMLMDGKHAINSKDPSHDFQMFISFWFHEVFLSWKAHLKPAAGERQVQAERREFCFSISRGNIRQLSLEVCYAFSYSDVRSGVGLLWRGSRGRVISRGAVAALPVALEFQISRRHLVRCCQPSLEPWSQRKLLGCLVLEGIQCSPV